MKSRYDGHPFLILLGDDQSDTAALSVQGSGPPMPSIDQSVEIALRAIHGKDREFADEERLHVRRLLLKRIAAEILADTMRLSGVDHPAHASERCPSASKPSHVAAPPPGWSERTAAPSCPEPQRFGDIERWWSGFLPDRWLIPMAPANALPLSAADRRDKQIIGVQIPLREVFGEETLSGHLSGVSGPLRIMCAYSSHDVIQTVSASIYQSRDDPARAFSIVLGLSDRYGTAEMLELTHERLARTKRDTSLRGRLSDIELTIWIRRSV